MAQGRVSTLTRATMSADDDDHVDDDETALFYVQQFYEFGGLEEQSF